TMVDAPDQDWQDAAGVRQVDLEFGMAVEHPSEDEMRGCGRRVDGVAEKVVEIEHAEALAPDRLLGMQKDRQIEGLDLRQNGLKHRIVEIVAVDLGPHIDAAHARLLRDTME